MKYVRGEVVKEGKKKIMPPGKREKLGPEEIQLLSRWIDGGAKPAAAVVKKELTVPKVSPKVPVRASVNAIAFSPGAKVVAVGRYQTVELLDPATRAVVRKLEGHKGALNALVFSPDGGTLFAGSGENALAGEIKVWRVADGSLVRTIEGHRDTIYALALSPDGKLLASGSYDQQIKLWNTETGAEVKTLRGHNGAVFGLAFRPDGKILASTSADRTVKLWDVATGQRRDTFSQPLKEQVAIAWSPDGKRVAAAGFDNRIRVWEVTPDAKETSNPLLIARYAHEQPITRLVWSGANLATGSQDGTIKLWEAEAIKERALIEKQPTGRVL
jgi:WD40 repeat protein